MRRTDVSLRSVVEGQTPVSVSETATVAQAAEAMAAAHKGAVLIKSNGQLLGIFTERDLVERVVARGLDVVKTPITEVMTRSLIVGKADDSHETALRRMVEGSCRHLPVVDGNHVLGVVSRRQLMMINMEQLSVELDRHEGTPFFF